MNILCIGHAVYDTTVSVLKYPQQNTRTRVSGSIKNGGGPANNAAFLLGKWGMSPYFAGVVGDDFEGKKIKCELETNGVSTKYLELRKNKNTTTSFIIANKENGTRTVITNGDDDLKLKDIKIDEDIDIILMDGFEAVATKQVLKQFPKAISIIDAGKVSDDVIELCHMVDYVVCSKEFASEVTNIEIDCKNNNILQMIMLKLEEMFKTNIIITLESVGCLYRYEDKIKLMPSLKVDVVDSTGAGDIFHGAFTYAIANNYKFEKCLKIANVAGAISVTRFGSHNSIPLIKEISEIIDDFR